MESIREVWAVISPKVGIDTDLLYTYETVEGDQCDAFSYHPISTAQIRSVQ